MKSKSKKAGFKKLGSGIDPDVVKASVQYGMALMKREADALIINTIREVRWSDFRGQKIKNEISEVLKKLRVTIAGAEIKVDPDSFEQIYVHGTRVVPTKDKKSTKRQKKITQEIIKGSAVALERRTGARDPKTLSGLNS